MLNHINFKHLLISVLCASIFLISGCAKIVTPSGGPKDTTPPKVANIDPPNNSLNFNSKQIKITFDEYVTLNNPTENILISPPQKEQPDYSIKGKSLIIKFKDSLRANTTYNIVFTDAVKDYHEGNALSMLHYGFSTGDSIDNYSIRGNILEAKTLAPAKDFFVMIYKNGVDSMPLTSTPDYVTKSLSDGSFIFNNISAGKYKIFALKDINSDLKYNLPNEEIAFFDSLIDAVILPNDTVADSLKTQTPLYTLFSFTAADTTQALQKFENPSAGKYIFPYKLPVNNFFATPLKSDVDYIEIINESRDTITWYFKTIFIDTLQYILTADNKTDTVIIPPYKERTQKGRGNTKSSNSLIVTTQNSGEIHKPLTLQFSYPIHAIDSFSAYIYTVEKNHADTSIVLFSAPDTCKMHLQLPMKYAEKKSYSIMIKDSVFQGYNNLYNDTIKINFTAKSVKDYGTLTINYKLPDNGKSYVATISSGSKKIAQNRLTKSESITYPYLSPGSYRVEVFCDENENGKWDVGDYSKKLQPERVIVFPQTISIRAYWESEETFNIE